MARNLNTPQDSRGELERVLDLYGIAVKDAARVESTEENDLQFKQAWLHAGVRRQELGKAIDAYVAEQVALAEKRGRDDGWDANRQNAIFWFRDLANKIDYYQSSGASDEDTIKGIQQWLDDQDRRLHSLQLNTTPDGDKE